MVRARFATGWVRNNAATRCRDGIIDARVGDAVVGRAETEPVRLRRADRLDAFRVPHDPPGPHRRGPDVGSRCRSATFTDDAAPAEAVRAGLPIREPLSTVHQAECVDQCYLGRVGGVRC